MKNKHDLELIAERYDQINGGGSSEIYVTRYKHNGGHDGFAEPELTKFSEVEAHYQDTCIDGDMEQFEEDVEENFKYIQDVLVQMGMDHNTIVCKAPKLFKSAIASGKLAVIQTGCVDAEEGAIFIGGPNAYATMTALYDAYVEGKW